MNSLPGWREQPAGVARTACQGGVSSLPLLFRVGCVVGSVALLGLNGALLSATDAMWRQPAQEEADGGG